MKWNSKWTGWQHSGVQWMPGAVTTPTAERTRMHLEQWKNCKQAKDEFVREIKNGGEEEERRG